MEEPIEREEVPETKEPIKAEPSTGASQADRAGAGSPTPECSICLGHLINTSFTDSCLHQFCFTCLLQWSKIKTECPLCKQTFKSIIHNVRSEEDYDQYHVPRELAQPPPVSPLGHLNLEHELEFIRHLSEPVRRRFAYRTTMTPNRRIRLLPNPTQAQAQTLADMVPTVSREELRYRRRNPSDFRRNVYRHGEWSVPLPGVYARALERSAEFFRSNGYELNRLIPWINRDLQILLNGNEAHIAYVLRTIMDSLTRHDLRSAELRDVLRPYFGIHTDHFLHELMNYARTGFDMSAYDSFITYPTHGLPRGYFNDVQSPAASSSSSLHSDDSDIRFVTHVGPPADLPAAGPHALDMPGPSTVSQAFQIRIPRLSPTILTISSNESESECEVVGYVKPRHERTPEIIEIQSSDGEVAGPSTSSHPATAPPQSPIRSPSFTPTPLDEPSTSQGSRRNPRGGRRRTTVCYANSSLNCELSDSSESDMENDWNKKVHRRRPKKTSKTCRKSPRKPPQRKEAQNTKKRSRKTSSSNDDDSPYETTKRKRTRRMPKSRAKLSSPSPDDEEEEPRQNGLIIKIRRDLMNQDERHTEDSSSSSMSSSSGSSSSFSDSDNSGSTSDTNLPLKKRRSGRSRRRSENMCERGRRSKGKLKSSVVKCPAVDATILKKDANKKEWYIDKKTSNSRSRSRSDEDTEISDTRLRISLNEYRERRAADQSSSTEPAVNDEEAKRSSSQGSSRSERIPVDKPKSRHKGKHKKDTEQASTSVEKHSDVKSPKKRRKSHKKHKSSKAKHSKGKTKRDKRLYSSSSSLSSI